MTATSDLRMKVRRAWLIEDAQAHGLYIRTYSPGDGVTRYRFFSNPTDDYFSADGLYTALGISNAEAWLSGYGDGSGR